MNKETTNDDNNHHNVNCYRVTGFPTDGEGQIEPFIKFMATKFNRNFKIVENSFKPTSRNDQIAWFKVTENNSEYFDKDQIVIYRYLENEKSVSFRLTIYNDVFNDTKSYFGGFLIGYDIQNVNIKQISISMKDKCSQKDNLILSLQIVRLNDHFKAFQIRSNSPRAGVDIAANLIQTPLISSGLKILHFTNKNATVKFLETSKNVNYKSRCSNSNLNLNSLNTVFIYNINDKPEEAIEQELLSFGQLLFPIKLATDKNNKKFAIAKFTTIEAASNACYPDNGSLLRIFRPTNIHQKSKPTKETSFQNTNIEDITSENNNSNNSETNSLASSQSYPTSFSYSSNSSHVQELENKIQQLTVAMNSIVQQHQQEIASLKEQQLKQENEFAQIIQLLTQSMNQNNSQPNHSVIVEEINNSIAKQFQSINQTLMSAITRINSFESQLNKNSKSSDSTNDKSNNDNLQSSTPVVSKRNSRTK